MYRAGALVVFTATTLVISGSRLLHDSNRQLLQTSGSYHRTTEQTQIDRTAASRAMLNGAVTATCVSGSFSPSDRICNSSQNGRGGLFFIVDDAQLHSDMTSLLKGGTAPYPGQPTPSPTPTPGPPSPPTPPAPPSPPAPPTPPSPGGACCYYADTRCSAGQTCCSGSGKSYSESSCSKYGAKHHCKWNGSACIASANSYPKF